MIILNAFYYIFALYPRGIAVFITLATNRGLSTGNPKLRSLAASACGHK